MSKITTFLFRWHIFAVVIFIAFQIQAMDYGTKINDYPHIRDYPVATDVARDSGLERDRIAGAGGGESLDRRMTRYKLYSIEADEHFMIMALARIKPAEGLFDPHTYQYGGAWLYPLGAWYLLLSETGVISVLPLEEYLSSPDNMDSVYFWGRVFVVLSVSGAALFLYAACRRYASALNSLLAMVIFLTAPGTLMFSQVMKPHWYALLWVCCALYILSRHRAGLPWRFRDTVATGLSIGLAVGSVLTFALFAVLCWLALLIFALRRYVRPRVLAIVPAIATGAYVLTNPFVILNWSNFQVEASGVHKWFEHGSPDNVFAAFITNSLLPGFGIGAVLLMLLVSLHALFAGPKKPSTWLAVAAGLIIALMAVMTSSLSAWHTNTRYVSYLLPAGMLFLCMAQWAGERGKTAVFSMVLASALIQSAPLAIAYRDENDPQHSTRHLSAVWIANNAEKNSALCLSTKTPAPFDTPPVNFAHYRINDPDCALTVRVEQQPDAADPGPPYTLVKRFQPRYTNRSFPLVFSHINPQISIYKNTEQ